ncbi:hypothetical protein HK102_013544 [Quaeritorhiza haematococci]|nr:hypothetical protein HK102_013544 [Quaeritorhiza haematococci]
MVRSVTRSTTASWTYSPGKLVAFNATKYVEQPGQPKTCNLNVCMDATISDSLKWSDRLGGVQAGAQMLTCLDNQDFDMATLPVKYVVNKQYNSTTCEEATLMNAVGIIADETCRSVNARQSVVYQCINGLY